MRTSSRSAIGMVLPLLARVHLADRGGGRHVSHPMSSSARKAKRPAVGRPRSPPKRRQRRSMPAITTAFALAVTHPAAGNLGGGGFIVVVPGRDSKEVVTVDFQRNRPQSFDPERMYLGPDGLPSPGEPGRRPEGGGSPRDGSRSGPGPRPKWGKAAMGRAGPKPAAKLARDGFPDLGRPWPRSLNGQLFPRHTIDPGRRGPRRPRFAQGDRLADFADFGRSRSRSPDGTRLGRRATAWSSATWPTTLDRIAAQEARTNSTLGTHGQEDRRPHGEARRPRRPSKTLPRYQAKVRPFRSTGTLRGVRHLRDGSARFGGDLDRPDALNILERFDLKADGPKSAQDRAPGDGSDAPGLLQRGPRPLPIPDFFERSG